MTLSQPDEGPSATGSDSDSLAAPLAGAGGGSPTRRLPPAESAAAESPADSDSDSVPHCGVPQCRLRATAGQ